MCIYCYGEKCSVADYRKAEIKKGIQASNKPCSLDVRKFVTFKKEETVKAMN